jgi:hypothetical protein
VKRKGWNLVGRRVRTPAGEVDVAARDGRCLVALEVKTGLVPSLARTIDPLLRPGRRFGRESLRRQRRAVRFLAGPGGQRTRVDLVEVLIEGSSGRARLLHHRDVRGVVVELARLKRSRGPGGDAAPGTAPGAAPDSMQAGPAADHF